MVVFLTKGYENRTNFIGLNCDNVRGTEGIKVWKLIVPTLKKYYQK
jgi:hypothetical protein